MLQRLVATWPDTEIGVDNRIRQQEYSELFFQL